MSVESMFLRTFGRGGAFDRFVLLPRKMRRRLARMGSRPGRRRATSARALWTREELRALRDEAEAEMRRRGLR